jgi:hypothetical protein
VLLNDVGESTAAPRVPSKSSLKAVAWCDDDPS